MPYVHVWVDPVECGCEEEREPVEIPVLPNDAEAVLTSAMRLLAEYARETGSVVRRIECRELIRDIEAVFAGEELRMNERHEEWLRTVPLPATASAAS